MGRLPTTTALLSRLQVFEPSRRPEKLVREPNTSWGTSRVEGRLGQGHADLLELILFLGRDPGEWPDERICVTVDFYKVRKVLGRGQESGGEQLNVWLSQIMDATLELRPKRWDAPIAGKLIDAVLESTKTVPAPGRLTSAGQRAGERHLKEIVLGQAMSTLIRHDVGLIYDPRPILNCKKGVAQALIRYVNTHNNTPNGGWKLETVLNHIGAGDDRDRSNKNRELKLCRSHLAGLGIKLEDDRVLR